MNDTIAAGESSSTKIPKSSSSVSIDLGLNASGFNWDKATRTGSGGIVIWMSSNLIDWSAPTLNRGGRHCRHCMGRCKGPLTCLLDRPTRATATLDRIGYTTFKDSVTFSPVRDCFTLANRPTQYVPFCPLQYPVT
ncbi:glycoside hydrolase family 43 [Colletotrichum orchidophilum]|uniref:Glycoside hydrolase family 43 n=1 Tax=Colletotrichum orchidophilum TaxID=1209926 RepID=A0A1G4BF57_9PEZI|nr:glycoside hydrolase family 43 [Colletotrichum orchidophilum]OHF00004.1 glycoside hydrolase family 43 [Colletotrichum orchidophilum]